jgi:hypothetical protein
MRSGARAGKKEAGIYGGPGFSTAHDEGIPSWTRRIEESVRNCFRGRGEAKRKAEAGEELLENLLDGLPAGFFILHDYRCGNGRIDNILVGPKGIFVLKVQSHNGTVAILGDQIFRNGRSFDSDKALIRQVREECRTLEELLAVRGIPGLAPLPVIVFTNSVVGLHGTIKGVEVLPLHRLPEFMRRRKDLISAREAEGIFEFLKIGFDGSSL